MEILEAYDLTALRGAAALADSQGHTRPRPSTNGRPPRPPRQRTVPTNPNPPDDRVALRRGGAIKTIGTNPTNPITECGYCCATGTRVTHQGQRPLIVTLRTP
jgi:hypothetical protein